MPSGALGLISKVSSRFFHEVMPVVLASVIGTMLVNHYSRQPASPSVVVEPPPPAASAEAMFQTLHDEHELIVDYLRRDAEAQHAAGAARDPAPLPASGVEDRPRKVRLVSTDKAAPRPLPRPAPEKTIPAGEPEPPQPVLARRRCARGRRSSRRHICRKRRHGRHSSGLDRQRVFGAGAGSRPAALRRSANAPTASPHQQSAAHARELTGRRPAFDVGFRAKCFRALYCIRASAFSSVNRKSVLSCTHASEEGPSATKLEQRPHIVGSSVVALAQRGASGCR